MPHSAQMETLADLTDDEVVSHIDLMKDHVMVEFDRRLVTTNRDLIQAIRDFESASDKLPAGCCGSPACWLCSRW